MFEFVKLFSNPSQEKAGVAEIFEQTVLRDRINM